MPRYVILTLLLALGLPLFGQSRSAQPRRGEGISTFLIRMGRPGQAYYKEFLELKIQEWAASVSDLLPEKDEEGREKPWEKGKKFSAEEVDGKLNITLSGGIYIDSLNLMPSLQNKIRRMAAFRNPKYYKNNAIGTSNYDTSRR